MFNIGVILADTGIGVLTFGGDISCGKAVTASGLLQVSSLMVLF